MTKQRTIKTLILVLLLITLTTIFTVSAEDQYQIKSSITASTPTKYETFGGGVAMNSELLIIGAPKGTSGGQSNAGVVYVYNDEGEYMYTIESPNPEPNAKFGESVTCSDEYILIGAYQETVDGISEAGRVYLYDLDGNLIHQLQSPEPGSQAHFGDSMDIYGDKIIVADEYAPQSITHYSKAYIFGTDGALITTVEPPMPMKGTLFGVSPRISSDYIAISEDVLSQVHIYSSDGEYLRTLESPMFYGQFGICTAINGEYIIIGESDANLVHVYDFDGNLLHTINPPEGHRGDFGFYVASEGNLIVVSEPNGDVDGISGAGYVFIYTMDGDLLSMIHSPDPQLNAHLGGGQYPQSLLDISYERIIVGEYLFDTDGLTDSGRAYIIEKGSFTVTLGDLTVEPSKINKGDSTTCSITCTNEGTFSGQYTVILKVDGEVREEKTISLDAGESETVSFEVSEDTVGLYQVDVNSVTDSFEVKDAVPGFPSIALIFGVMAAVLSFKKRY